MHAHQIASIVTLAVLWGCLVFTLSRSSLAALALGLAVLAALRWRARPVLYLARRRGRGRRGCRGCHTPEVRPLQRPEHQVPERRLRAAAPTSITGGIKLFGDGPLQGWGSGSFSAEVRAANSPRRRVPSSDSHNIPVTIAAEQGLIGLSCSTWRS